MLPTPFGGPPWQRCTHFPLRRAFALTINKSQGCTLRKVLLDLREDVFAHGHLYVGVSRVTNCHNIAMYIRTDRLYDDVSGSLPIAINIVYPEVLNVIVQSFKCHRPMDLADID